MKKYYFRNFYGSTASILVNRDGRSLLTIRYPNGSLMHSKTYKTERGARIALGMWSDSWSTQKGA